VGVVLIADAALTTVPQLARLRRGAEGVSRTTWTSMAFAAACWVAYGAAHGDVALIVSQSVRVMAATTIVALATVRIRGSAVAGRGMSHAAT
jgi:hypothetical protein